MKKLVLHIYDWLSARKGLAIFLMAFLLGLCTLSALRMHYEEDISAFLPQSEESKRYSDVYNRAIPRSITASGRTGWPFSSNRRPRIPTA